MKKQIEEEAKTGKKALEDNTKLNSEIGDIEMLNVNRSDVPV